MSGEKRPVFPYQTPDFRSFSQPAALATPSPAPEPVAVGYMTQADIQRLMHGEQHPGGQQAMISSIALFDRVQPVFAHPPGLQAEVERLKADVRDYEEVLAGKRDLARQIDVAMHGEEGAAKRPSLCDLVGSASDLRTRAETAEALVETLEAKIRDLVLSQQANEEATEAALTASRARVGELLEGLEPFAKAADDWDCGDSWPIYTASDITVGDLRRARTLLTKEPS